MKYITYIETEDWIDITIPPVLNAEFKQLVIRAIQTWQDISPEMRDFADRVRGIEHIVGDNMKPGLEKINNEQSIRPASSCESYSCHCTKCSIS